MMLKLLHGHHWTMVYCMTSSGKLCHKTQFPQKKTTLYKNGNLMAWRRLSAVTF